MEHNLDERYKPITMWGYFGYQILFAIPVIGFIALLVCAFNKNYNVRNFARSYFCVVIIALVIIGILLALGVGGALLTAIADKIPAAGV